MSFLSELSDVSLFVLIAMNADTREDAPVWLDVGTDLKRYLLEYYGSSERLRQHLSPQIHMLLNVERQICERQQVRNWWVTKQKDHQFQWLQQECEKNKCTKAKGNTVLDNILVKYRNWKNEHVVDVRSDPECGVQMSGGQEWFHWSDKLIWESGGMNFIITLTDIKG